MLTQGAIPAYDARVCLVGLDAYQAAGGQVQRDLFTKDCGGWVADVALLERLMGEHFQAAADQVRAEGWKWVTTDPADARAIWYNTRRIWPHTVALSEADLARRAELATRLDEVAIEHPYGTDDAPDDVQAEVQALHAELDVLDQRERAFHPEDMARAGATIMLANDGTLTVERGFVRPEDEPRPEPAPEDMRDAATSRADHTSGDNDAAKQDQEAEAQPHNATPDLPAANKFPALPADLDTELTAHRTAALRAEIVRQPDLALRVLAHGLATAAVYGPYLVTVARVWSPYGASTSTGSVSADSPARQAITAAEDEQRARMPGNHADLWAWLQTEDTPALHALIAVCVARMADAGGDDWTEAQPIGAQVAQTAGLDMRQWWTATSSSYLGRVTKAGILAAVREGTGEGAVLRIEGMKKEAMAANAEALLAGKGWLPARLRMPGVVDAAPEASTADVPEEVAYLVAAE